MEKDQIMFGSGLRSSAGGQQRKGAMSSQQEFRVIKKEMRTITSGDGQTTTVTTETVETSDGRTVQRTVTERSQTYQDSLKAFQTLSLVDHESQSPKKVPQKSIPATSRKSEAAADPVAPAASAGSLKSAFQEDALKWHNYYRQKHGVSPVKLSPTLCAYAEEWANKLAKTNSFQHRSNNKYGENLYMKGCSNPNYQVTGKEAVESWYSEIKDHTFGVEPRSMGTGHFTQVVWKTTTEMGIASAKGSGGRHYVVANYNPAGNFIGQYAANVPSPK